MIYCGTPCVITLIDCYESKFGWMVGSGPLRTNSKNQHQKRTEERANSTAGFGLYRQENQEENKRKYA